MAFRQWFLRPPEVCRIVLPKALQNFKKTPNCTCWPRELNQKCFPRNIQYSTRPNGPPSRYFRHCETFFREKFPPKIFPFFRLTYNTGRDFFGIVRHFRKKFPKGPLQIILEFRDRMDEKSQRVTLARQFGSTFGFFGCFRREFFDLLKCFCYF